MHLSNILLIIVSIVSTTLGKENITIQRFSVNFVGERVVGGTETAPNEFPWYALLTTRTRQQFCGASILSEEFVLTATHCMILNKNDFFVAAGVHNRLITIDGTEQYARVEEIFNHPDYAELPMENDVTILRVNPPFKFNQYVGAIALPTSNSVPIEMVTAIGWGMTNYTIANGSFDPSPVLKKINLTIQATEECSKNYEDVFWQGGIPSKITDRMICAASDREMESVCQGDSGGGLRCEDSNGKQFVCGVASFLAGCGFQKYASVYTKVDRYIDFIRSRTGLYDTGATTTTTAATATAYAQILSVNTPALIWCVICSLIYKIIK